MACSPGGFSSGFSNGFSIIICIADAWYVAASELYRSQTHVGDVYVPTASELFGGISEGEIFAPTKSELVRTISAEGVAL